MNVLSLFDGISCGQIALERANIKVDNYFASEINKNAIKVTQKNYPNTIQLGDIKQIKGKDLPRIDLVIGGSPCQDLSIANRYRLGLEGEKSSLFFEFLRLLKECQPKYFLLENVNMKKEWKNIISSELWVSPICINSNLVSAQNRKRLYWTNIPNIEQPKDKNILLKNILEDNYENIKSYKLNRTPSRDTYWFGKKYKNITHEFKSSCLTTRMERWSCAGLIEFEDYCRFLTSLECERLQTLPEGYTDCLSKNQRYKVIGDGWTVDIIAHIFRNICIDSLER
jgi:DNA (cytosine-5)-methyltransferase 3A